MLAANVTKNVEGIIWIFLFMRYRFSGQMFKRDAWCVRGLGPEVQGTVKSDSFANASPQLQHQCK